MSPEIFDILLALALVALMPLYGIWSQRRYETLRRTDPSAARLDGYRLTMLVEWGLAVAAIALWFLARRDFAALGLGFETGTAAWIGIGLGIAACAALVAQSIALVRKPEALRDLRDSIGSLESLVPRDEREAREFAALSVTAGICEELLYRGFLLALLTPLVGTVAAVVVSSVGFGLAHLYQGSKGFAKTTAVGLAMAGLFVLTGALWIPMLVHVVVDLNAGFLGRRALEGVPGPEAAATTG